MSETAAEKKDLGSPAGAASAGTGSAAVSQHTPLPWRASGPVVIDQYGNGVANCVMENIEVLGDEGNAAFIARACNAHADLLKVAKQQAASYFRQHFQHGMREGYRCLECQEEILGPRPDGLRHDQHCELSAAIAKATQPVEDPKDRAQSAAPQS